MERPLAFKLIGAQAPAIYRVKMDPLQVEHQAGSGRPAVVVSRGAAILSNVSAGMIDGDNIVAAIDGDWEDALLIVLPEASGPNADVSAAAKGDEAFLAEVRQTAPALATLAEQTIVAIRSAGVSGELAKSKLGRWVNQPLNTFTLKVQPRAGNLHFTLYGNPSSYQVGDFLLQDQNSYSRGWVRDPRDAKRLAELARQAHARRKG